MHTTMPGHTCETVATRTPLPAHYWRRRCYEIVEQSRGNDCASRWFDLFLISIIVLNVTALVFESVPDYEARFETYFYWTEVLTTIVFSIEYLLRLWSCVEAPRFNKPTLPPWQQRLLYVVSFMALIDLLAVVPFFMFQFGLFPIQDLSFLKTLRLFRVFKLTRYSRTMQLLQHVLNENRQLFIATLAILIVVMLIAACGIYLFERDAQPQAFGSIPAAMWWAFATLTTVGYGDVTPITIGGRIFGAGITVLSVGMVALPAGILASSFSEQIRNRERAFQALADQAFTDGLLTDREAHQLESFRAKLGLNKSNAKLILRQYREQQREQQMGVHCPHCGHSLAATKKGPPRSQDPDGS